MGIKEFDPIAARSGIGPPGQAEWAIARLPALEQDQCGRGRLPAFVS